MQLPKESIKADIAAFNKRIEDARFQLLALSAPASSWKERKRISLMRNRLMSEIDHVKRIRQYAVDALSEV